MFGVILVVQVVHYPLFRHVAADAYPTFQVAHMRRITWIVAPAMALELGTAIWIVIASPAGVQGWPAWTGLGLALLIWAATALVQGPLHRRLADGFDADLHRHLVRTNWVRTVVWAGRAALVLWMVALGAR